MLRDQALALMVPPSQRRAGKPMGGVIQVHVTRACDKACFGCTQGSQLGGPLEFMPFDLFEKALQSLQGYWGIVGVFGGNPAMHPQFLKLCEIVRRYVPMERAGLWCNNPRTLANAQAMASTFNPRVSNLNVHLDGAAWELFRHGWPQSLPFGLSQDSRHSPTMVALKDVLHDEGKRWNLISRCDINQHWSAMVGMFRGELRAWFCEIAGAQSILHQHDESYPDTGLDPAHVWSPGPRCDDLPEFVDYADGIGEYKHTSSTSYMLRWWELGMVQFAHQVDKHCHECGVPLRGRGELAMAEDGVEQVSEAHASVFKPKRKRRVETVTQLAQLGPTLQKMTDYLGNARR